MKTFTSQKTLLAAFLILLMAGAYPVSSSAASKLDTLYQAAKKEGKVVFWSAQDAEALQAMAKKFEARYPGVSVEDFEIEPGPALQRIVTEAQAGQVNVDAFDTLLSYLPQLLNRNLVVPYDWQGTFGIDPQYTLFNNRAVAFWDLSVPIVYNTSMVEKGEITSWADLLKPKWRGRIGLEARGIAFPILVNAWGEKKTTDYLKKLLKNNPVIIKGGTPTAEAVAGGQVAVAIGTYAGKVERYKSKGAPVEWARVSPVPSMVYVSGVVKGAPHPNAAKLWCAWLASPEGQKFLYKYEYFGLLKGKNATPIGKEMQKARMKVVLESTNVDRSRRLLEKYGDMIRSSR